MFTKQYRLILEGENLAPLWNVEVTYSDEGKILAIDELKYELDLANCLIPGFFNSHVHSADIGLRGIGQYTLSELVGEGGIKSRHLEHLSDDALKLAINKCYEEAKLLGIQGWADFREGGLRGIQPYHKLPSSFIAFGRPIPGDDLEQFNYFGIRDVAQYTSDQLQLIVEHAHKFEKPIFIHASEDIELRNQWVNLHSESDVIWSLRNISPRAIIHLTHADEEDFTEMKLSKVGAVFCLGSNQFTKVGIPNIPLALELGLEMAIGTDNAMMQSLSIGNEIRKIHHTFPDISIIELIKLGSVNGAKLVDLDFSLKIGNSNYIELNIPQLRTSHQSLDKSILEQLP